MQRLVLHRRGYLRQENDVLREKDAVANLAVKDLSRAKQFYEGTLGFEPVGHEGNELIVYRSGDGMQVAWFKDPDGNILNIVSR